MKENKRRSAHKNAWKQFGAVMLSAAIVCGTCMTPLSAFAEETEEEPQRITLNFGDQEDSDDEGEDTVPETEEETETETEPETFEAIENVKTDHVTVVTTDVSGIVEAVLPSVVSITMKSTEEISDYYGGTVEYESLGSASGVIVAQNDSELLIATNNHVVAEAKELSVGFTVEAEDPEDLLVEGRVKGTDMVHELAIVAVRLKDIPENVRSQVKIAQLGKSGDLKVGQPIIVIGNALGYGISVTSGIVSALDKEESKDEFADYEGTLIQSDAAVNLGNSGGPWLNAKGEVIGINLGKIVGAAADNIGYAIPIDMAVPILENLINRETREKLSNTERGYLGCSVVDVSDDAKELYDIPVGAFVHEVNPGSAGELAGIRKGDVITAFDGIAVRSTSQLIDTMQYYRVGETVKVEVMTTSNGVYESREVEVTLLPGADAATDDAAGDAAAEDSLAQPPVLEWETVPEEDESEQNQGLPDILEDLLPYGDDEKDDFEFFNQDW